MSRKVKTKKVVGVPTVPLTHRGYRTMDQMDRVYGGLGTQGTVISDDPLAQYEREEAVEALQELRDLKAQKRRLELKQKIEQEKHALGAIDTSGGGLNIRGMYNFTPAELTAISQKSDADKAAFFDTMKQIQLMGAMQPRGGVGGAMGNPILQMMAMGGFNRQGQGLGLKDVMEMQNMMRTIYEGAGKGNQELTNTLLMKLMTETVPGLQQQANQATQQGLGAVIQMLQANQSDPMRDLEYLKKGAGMLGYTPQNVSNEVAKMRIEMEDRWANIAHQDRREELKYRRELGIMEKIIDTVTGFTKNVTRSHFSDLFTPKPAQQVQQPVQQAVQQATAPVQPATQEIRHRIPPDAQSPSGVQLIQHSCQGCGQLMVAPAGVAQVSCPVCGHVSQV